MVFGKTCRNAEKGFGICMTSETTNCGELMVPGGTPLRTASESLYSFLGGGEHASVHIRFLRGKNKLTVFVLSPTFKTDVIPKEWHGFPVFIRRAFRAKDL